MQPKVLLVGNDESLLNIRGMLLRGDARVKIACGLSRIEEDDCQEVALVVLCHTLSLTERIAAIEFVRKASPRAKILILLTLTRSKELPEHASAGVLEGPGELLTVSRDLIDRWQKNLP